MKKIVDQEDPLILTLNKMGYMNTEPEFYNDAFVEFSAQCSYPCLETGTAYGKTTLAALKKGATIIANDLSKAHLDILLQNTPQELRKNLTLIPGAFPEVLSIEENSLGAVLSSRMLNFLEPQILPLAFREIFKWLRPGGKFFILVSSPYMGNFKSFVPYYLNARAQNKEWPGLLKDMAAYNPGRAQDLPSFMNLLDIEDIALLLIKAGFHIENIGYSSVSSRYPDDVKFDGREHVGAIGIKPNKN